uniref:SH3 and multiple ankyrin repeat domains protein 1-like n=1 Tax=Saccoglossus kowalevskii TaxID=10224 RepID=A0ABM0MEE5_SACKO|nr:PREDICTED: SH3 and multiple ankyrin repeat domains protein 1-like [Saccoglossus kowalevskii]
MQSSGSENSDSIYVRVSIPEQNLQKCLCFHLDKTVYTAKQQVLSTLAKELKDGNNYGFYSLPENGRAGKFLEEERPLRDYPLSSPIGYLEFKYKRRVYKQLKLDKMQIRKIHTKANLKVFMDHVKSRNIDKVRKFLDKGLDPNYHDDETGETPLTLASSMDRTNDIILLLVNGGAHQDFRSTDGLTPVHKAAKKGNYSILKTLLDLGASPNYHDNKGLTPLYHTVTNKVNAECTQLLLHERCELNAADGQGWREIHQACRYGRVQHLEHLLYYGAIMNVQNGAGNTAIHVCALYNQEQCARVLLFRGADKDIKNYANQTAFQVAIVANNFDLAEIIRNHGSEDVVPFRDAPKYSMRRRPSSMYVHSTWSDTHIPQINGEYSSPNGSLRSLPIGYAGSSSPRSIGSTGSAESLLSSTPRKPEDMYRPVIVAPSTSTLPRSSSFLHNARCLNTSKYEERIKQRPHSIAAATCTLPRSKNGTKNSIKFDSSKIMTHKKLYDCTPGRTFIAVKNYTALEAGELSLKKGDFVEVLNIGEHNFWEGSVKGSAGWFPSYCVEEVKMRGKKVKEETFQVEEETKSPSSVCDNHVRTVVLHRTKKGYGFVLRGAKSSNPSLEFQPSAEFPALQYLDAVDKGGVAHKAELEAGDFLVEVNGEDVVKATHRHVVELVKKSGDTLVLKVVTVVPTKPYAWLDKEKKEKSKKAPKPPERSPDTRISQNLGENQNQTFGPDEIAALEELEDAIKRHSSMGDLYLPSENPSRHASIKSRPTTPRRSQAEMYEIFERQGSIGYSQNSQNPSGPRVIVPEGVKAATLKRNSQIAGADGGSLYYQENVPRSNLRSASSTPNLASAMYMKRRQSSPSGTVRSDGYYRPVISRPILIDSTSEQESVQQSVIDYRRRSSLTDSETTSSPVSSPRTPDSPAVYAVPFRGYSDNAEASVSSASSMSSTRNTFSHQRSASISSLNKPMEPPPPPPSSSSQKIPSSFNPDNPAKLYMLPPAISEHGIRSKLKQHQHQRTNSLTDRTNNPMPAKQSVHILPQPDYIEVGRQQKLQEGNAGTKKSSKNYAAPKPQSQVPVEVHASYDSQQCMQHVTLTQTDNVDASSLSVAKARAALDKNHPPPERRSSDSVLIVKEKEELDSSALNLALKARDKSIKETPKKELVKSVDPSTALRLAVEKRRIELEAKDYKGVDIDKKIQENKYSQPKTVTNSSASVNNTKMPNVSKTTTTTMKSAKVPENPANTGGGVNDNMKSEIQLAAAAMQNRLATKSVKKRNFTINKKEETSSGTQKKIVIINSASVSKEVKKQNELEQKKADQNARVKANLQSKKTESHEEALKSSIARRAAEIEEKMKMKKMAEKDTPGFIPPPPVDTNTTAGFVLDEALPPPLEFSTHEEPESIPNIFTNEKGLTNEERNRMNHQRAIGHEQEESRPGFNTIRKKFEAGKINRPVVDKTFKDSDVMYSIPPPPLPDTTDQNGITTVNIVPPPPPVSFDDRTYHYKGRTQREHSFDTASTVSSVSTLSTLSSLSAYSADNSEMCETIPEVDSESDTLKSHKSSSSHRTLVGYNPGNHQEAHELIRRQRFLDTEHTIPVPFRSSQGDLTAADSRTSTPPPPSDFTDTAYSSANSETGGSEDGRENYSFNSGTHSIKSFSSLSKPLDEWTAEDVGDWLDSINMGEHRATFVENEITGEHLPALAKDDYIELGVIRVGHRMTIDRALKKLK